MASIERIFGWEPAIAEARRGNSADLARLVRRALAADGERPPADLLDAIELAVANPVQPHRAGRKRLIGEYEAALVCIILEHTAHGEKAATIDRLARQCGVSAGTIRDVFARRGSYRRSGDCGDCSPFSAPKKKK